jgi:PKD repeat protein
VERGQKIILKINLEEVIMKRMNSLVAFAIVLASFCIVVMPASAEDISANFSASPTSGYAPLTVGFHDQSPGSPTAWKWSFGDGSPLVMGYNPTHTYTKAGVYTVKETVSNSVGKDTEIKTNYINVKASVQKPVAAFTASPLSGKKSLTVKFTDKSTGLITSRSWNFGDKSTSTVKNPVHKYTKAGKYTVTLTVKNTAGSNIAKKTNYITVK